MSREKSETPDELIYEEDGTPLFLAASFSPEDAADNRGLTLDEAIVTEEWYSLRAVTEEETADPDALYDLFGHWDDWSSDPPTRVYSTTSSERPGAHKYLRVTESARVR